MFHLPANGRYNFVLLAACTRARTHACTWCDHSRLCIKNSNPLYRIPVSSHFQEPVEEIIFKCDASFVSFSVKTSKNVQEHVAIGEDVLLQYTEEIARKIRKHSLSKRNVQCGAYNNTNSSRLCKEVTQAHVYTWWGILALRRHLDICEGAF